MPSSLHRAEVVPACLSFLAIYNPSLSNSEESVHDQIVYYYDKTRRHKKDGKSNGGPDTEESRDELNEKLRQVGLAQGMVQFASGFANGDAVDAIETEKSRIILHNLEEGWWILASIDLTQVPSSPEVQVKNEAKQAGISVEYSAREVALPALLLQQLLRAHQIFLLHQAPCLAALWEKVSRSKFCGFLKRFWDSFIYSWDVLLHGNPAVDIYNGLKLSAGGELGIGVGEEEWGSGEREVLEGFVGRTDGLVDLVVSRFGDAAPKLSGSRMDNQACEGYGAGQHPGPSDGVIFSGVGTLTRSSIRDISSWMEWLYVHGQNAYGVRDNPSSSLRRKGRRLQPPPEVNDQADISGNPLAAIPPPIVPPPSTPGSKNGSKPASNSVVNADSPEELRRKASSGDGVVGTETLVKYLTLGVYGSQWGLPSGRPPTNQEFSARHRGNVQAKAPTSIEPGASVSEETLSKGYYLVGLLGQLDEDVRQEDDLSQDTELETDREYLLNSERSNRRVVVRTLHVERQRTAQTTSADGPENTTDEVFFDRLRVVVYVQEPFMFAFIFEMQSDVLAMPSFYRSIHHQLGPLQRPLLTSTSPKKVAERLWEAASPRSTNSNKSTQPISDLVYDPSRLTIHTTIPNIPEPVIGSSGSSARWTRAEAMTVHSQVLNVYTSTRRHTAELERTCKTSRGWWVVWMRLPHAPTTSRTHSSSYREAFLIRKASDYVAPAARKASGRFGRDTQGANDSAGWGPSKLAEGIGIDARQYIEGLLSLTR